MADVRNDVEMQSAADERQKRVFGDITNGEKKTKKTKQKKPKKEPPKTYTLNWTAAERATKEAPSNAMLLSDVFRQPYAVSTAVQATHAPKIKDSAVFPVHEGANILAAVKARKSGAAPLAPAGRLKRNPLWGGISSRKNAPPPPANIVGVHEKNAAASKKANDRQDRMKQQRAKGKPSPEFQLWRGDKEAREASPFYTSTAEAYKDCLRRWPNVDKKHPDYATTKITQDLVGVLHGKSPNKFGSKRERLREERDNTEWKFAWKDQ